MAKFAVHAVISTGIKGITTHDARASGGKGMSERYVTASRDRVSHVCCLYQTDAEHTVVVSRFIQKGLVQNEKVMLILDVDERTPFLNSLAFDDEEVRAAIARGQLMLSSTDETYLSGSSFHPTQMIARLMRETTSALEDGYAGLRVTSDMGWVRRRSIKFATLLRYEAVVNDFLAQHRCMGLCRYHRWSFPTAVLGDIASLHPRVISEGQLFTNPQHALFSDLLKAVNDETEL
jgi:hypothetical protein